MTWRVPADLALLPPPVPIPPCTILQHTGLQAVPQAWQVCFCLRVLFPLPVILFLQISTCLTPLPASYHIINEDYLTIQVKTAALSLTLVTPISLALFYLFSCRLLPSNNLKCLLTYNV